MFCIGLRLPLQLPKRQYLTLLAAVIISCTSLFFYLFTQELLPKAIAIPRISVSDYLPSASSNSTRAEAPKYAFATFLSTRVDEGTAIEKDVYFTATRVLSYQLLHHPQTRTQQNIPFIIIVPPHVSALKRDILSSEGATVIEVPLLNPTNWTANPGEPRWVDQFTKLRLFELTEYDRILYMDTDMLLTRPLDSIFAEAIVHEPQWTANDTQSIQQREGPLPETYVLSGTPDNGGPGSDHPAKYTPQAQMNGGFWCMQPSVMLFNYYVTLLELGHFESWNMEMGLLNYAHRAGGPMPWKDLPAGKWSSNWPRLRDVESGSATLHDKFWSSDNKDWIDRELVEMWWRVQGQMEGFWQRHRKMYYLKRRNVFGTIN